MKFVIVTYNIGHSVTGVVGPFDDAKQALLVQEGLEATYRACKSGDFREARVFQLDSFAEHITKVAPPRKPARRRRRGGGLAGGFIL